MQTKDPHLGDGSQLATAIWQEFRAILYEENYASIENKEDQ